MNIKPVKIGNRFIGPGYPTYIIFEVASTHANDWQAAKAYIKLAKKAGADALKFQLFKTDTLLNPLAKILKPTYDHLKSAETPREWFPKLNKLCKKAGLDLLCTPFDEDSAVFLDKIGIPAIKIASGDLTNHQLLAKVSRFGKPIILSTGMAQLDEIKDAVSLLKKYDCEELLILQCVSIYPTPYEDANVLAMNSLMEEFGHVVGYSDNGSEGDLVPRLAVAFGACVIEKHVTSQKERGNMDDVFSLSVNQFAKMTKRIRKEEKLSQQDLIKLLKVQFGEDVEKALGDGIKKPASFGTKRTEGVERRMTEWDERHWARRGIYPIKNIDQGTKITPEMVIALRPDVGVSCLDYDKIIGAIATEKLKEKNPLYLSKGKLRNFKKADIKKVYSDDDPQFVKILSDTALFE